MPRFLIAAVLASALLAVPCAGAGPVDAAAAAAAACPAGFVSLTFDDGPSATVTPRLVGILRRVHAPATFFMVGQRVASAPAAARLVGSSGFLVGNHSYRHRDMTTQTRAQIRATLRATERRLRATGLQPTRLMRPPYGAIDDRVRRAVHSVGLVPVLWDVDPRDWAGGSTRTIARRILAGLRPNQRNIVLQHDGVANSAASIAAVPRVVRVARSRGYCFVALDENGQPGFPTPVAKVELTGAAEGGQAVATVHLDRPTARTTTVRLDTRELEARAGSDFTSRDAVLRFPAGATRSRVGIPILRDGTDEPVERFEVLLSRPVGVRIGTARAVGSITDRDRPTGVSAVDRAVPEPTDQAVTVPVRLRLGHLSGYPVRLRVRTVAGTAGAEDYQPFRVTVTVPAGRRSTTVPVTVLPDAVDEQEETFVVRITRATHARVVRADATATITPPAASTDGNRGSGALRRTHPSPRR